MAVEVMLHLSHREAWFCEFSILNVNGEAELNLVASDWISLGFTSFSSAKAPVFPF